MCDSVKLSLVVGKVDVRYMGDLSQEARINDRLQLNYKSYFYSYVGYTVNIFGSIII